VPTTWYWILDVDTIQGLSPFHFDAHSHRICCVRKPYLPRRHHSQYAQPASSQQRGGFDFERAIAEGVRLNSLVIASKQWSAEVTTRLVRRYIRLAENYKKILNIAIPRDEDDGRMILVILALRHHIYAATSAATRNSHLLIFATPAFPALRRDARSADAEAEGHTGLPPTGDAIVFSL
jgi:hypothetical protein